MKANGRRTRNTDEYVLTRGQVAKRLGVSVTTVRRMEGDVLHPVADDDGIWRFDPADLEGMERREREGSRVQGNESRPDDARATARRGRVAAKVFEMFAEYRTLPEIVVATRLPPDAVRALFQEWRTGLDYF